MKNKKIRMKGLKTPSSVVFMHGFLNGRFKSAGIDLDSGLLNSAYVNGMMDLFYKYCQERVDKLETEISAICTEAETLFIELKAIPDNMSNRTSEERNKEKIPDKLPTTIQEAQEMRAIARRITEAKDTSEHARGVINDKNNRRTEIVQRLVQIRDRIITKENNCYNELNATAFLLKERFCIYGHGVLLQPVLNRYIPAVDYAGILERYDTNHHEIKSRISALTKKEEKENV